MKKIIVVLGLCFMLSFVGVSKVKAEAITPNDVAKEIVNWTYQQNVGITCLWDLDKKKYDVGARWQFFQSQHQWLYSGLCADLTPSVGAYVSFNFGKLIEKIKGQPLVYLKHLETGYYYMHDFDKNKGKDGLFINIIKVEF